MPSYIDQMYGVYVSEHELYHHGILGQRWGVRRYQNADGSLTDAGKRRAAKQEYRTAKKNAKINRRNKTSSDYEKIEGDMLYGTTSLSEATRRGANSERLRKFQSKADTYNAKSKMASKLSENSQGLSKKYRQHQMQSSSKKSDRYNTLANKTKNMIDITNDVYEHTMSNGEKIASSWLLNNAEKNEYMMDRARMSAQKAAGKAALKKAVTVASQVGISAIRAL